MIQFLIIAKAPHMFYKQIILFGGYNITSVQIFVNKVQ